LGSGGVLGFFFERGIEEFDGLGGEAKAEAKAEEKAKAEERAKYDTFQVHRRKIGQE